MESKIIGIGFILTLLLFSCSKEDEGGCRQCEQSEAVEICDNGDGTISLVIEGTTRETGTIPEGSSFNEIANNVCESIEVEDVNACFECMGPNVQDFDVCKTDEGITVDGVLIDDTEGLTVAEAVEILESNPNDDETFENLSCQAKN